MTFRRLAALLTSACLLNLSVAAGDSACTTHGPGDASSAAMPDGMAMSHDASADAAPEHGDMPAPQRCCEAQAGCNVTGVIVAGAEVEAMPAFYAARPDAPQIDAPTSFTSPPEPPPPKA